MFYKCALINSPSISLSLTLGLRFTDPDNLITLPTLRTVHVKQAEVQRILRDTAESQRTRVIYVTRVSLIR